MASLFMRFFFLFFSHSPFKSKKTKKNLSLKHPFARCTLSVRNAIFLRSYTFFKMLSVKFRGRDLYSNEEKKERFTWILFLHLFLFPLAIYLLAIYFSLRFILFAMCHRAVRIINDRRVGLESLLIFFYFYLVFLLISLSSASVHCLLRRYAEWMGLSLPVGLAKTEGIRMKRNYLLCTKISNRILILLPVLGAI